MPHISYSELKQWTECTWRHKLLYLDRIDTFQGNEHTSFGTAVHEAVEQMLLDNIKDPYIYFDNKFTEELRRAGITKDTALASAMREQVVGIFELVEVETEEV